MDLQELRKYLDQLSSSLAPEERDILEARLQGLVSVFPFSEYEFILMFLRDREVISFGEYEKLRDNYVSTNSYLDLFGLAPRVFGQIWGERHKREGLKPCPFCGASDTVLVVEQVLGCPECDDNCYIRCNRCFAGGPNYEDEQRAESAWNERQWTEDQDVD